MPHSHRTRRVALTRVNATRRVRCERGLTVWNLLSDGLSVLLEYHDGVGDLDVDGNQHVFDVERSLESRCQPQQFIYPQTQPWLSQQQQQAISGYGGDRDVNIHKGKRYTKICIAPHCENLTSEALRYESHSFYPANTPYLPSPRKRSPLPSDSSYLIAAYYSFIDHVRIKGWVGLVSWPTADVLPMVTHQLQVRCRPGKVRRSETDVLPLSYTAKS